MRRRERGREAAAGGEGCSSLSQCLSPGAGGGRGAGRGFGFLYPSTCLSSLVVRGTRKAVFCVLASCLCLPVPGSVHGYAQAALRRVGEMNPLGLSNGVQEAWIWCGWILPADPVNLGSAQDYTRKKNKWLPKIKEWIELHARGDVLIPVR